MEHKEQQDVELASTVTALLSKGSNTLKNNSERRGTKSKKSQYVGSYGDKDFYSSSKLLTKYIRDYDKNQVWDLAKDLTNAAKSLSHNGDKENEANKEINLAKKLLGNTRSSECDDIKSMTTDDLLASNPYIPLSEIDLNSVKPEREKTRSLKVYSRMPKHYTPRSSTQETASMEHRSSLHFSHIASNRSNTTPTTSDTLESTIHDESELNLFSLNGTSYTPHRVKYGPLVKEFKQVPQSTGNGCSFYKDRGDHVCQSPTPTNLLIDERPTIDYPYAVDAGRTPFRTRTLPIHINDSSLDNSRETLFNSDMSFEETLTSKTLAKSLGSSSHISVPFHIEDKSSDIRGFIEDCLADDITTNLSTKPSGSVETLKNMIFTLQSISSNDTSNDPNENAFINDGDIVMDGHRSLRQAMSHLSNLKDLTRSGNSS
uniref:uncharacterized protein LOC120347736 n=1 Tax=Styela clava TaxID=7725 RepID=UPI00193A9510|nr:uncharacterized protein LOC120347736 [Styela clava]